MKKIYFGERHCRRVPFSGSSAIKNALIASMACVSVMIASCNGSSPKAWQLLFTKMVYPYTMGETVAAPGTLYSIDTSRRGDVVYFAGNLPVIITVPHGGSLEPHDIPDREDDPAWSSAYNTANDAMTIELAWDIVEELKRITNGKYPHVIINNLSRTKIDQNRAWGDECNPTAGRGGEAWTDFHENFTASVAIQSVLDDFGRGLYIDLHGKPNSVIFGYWESVMIGYNLFGSVLSNNTDDDINNPANGYAARSTLRFLSNYVSGDVDFAGLLRGANPGHESFGSLLQDGLDGINLCYDKTYTVVPSDVVPEPEYLYLSGEYNVRAFCGVNDGEINNPYGYTSSRFMSGFQLEVSREIRTSDPHLRNAFAREVAEAVAAYLARHYAITL